MRSKLPLAAVFPLALAACLPAVETPPDSPAVDPARLAGCGGDGLTHVIGRRLTDADVHDRTGPVRIIPPGAMVTTDLRPDRLNVDLDKDRVVVRLWCG